ncbi:MAG: hypothetical protein ACRDNT_08890 [Streptosporangiaceae bacterium]
MVFTDFTSLRAAIVVTYNKLYATARCGGKPGGGAAMGRPVSVRGIPRQVAARFADRVLNVTHIEAPLDPVQASQAQFDGRDQADRAIALLRAEFPKAFGEARVRAYGYPWRRQTRWIRGRHQLTTDEVRHGTRFDLLRGPAQRRGADRGVRGRRCLARAPPASRPRPARAPPARVPSRPPPRHTHTVFLVRLSSPVPACGRTATM